MTPGLSLLGIARRAGKLAVGEAAAAQAVAEHQAKLILLAADAGESTEKRVLRLENRRLIVARLSQSKAELGAAVGCAPCAAAAVLDLELAAAVLEKLAAAEPDRFSVQSGLLLARKEKARRRRMETRSCGKKSKRNRPAAGTPSERDPDRTAGRKKGT